MKPARATLLTAPYRTSKGYFAIAEVNGVKESIRLRSSFADLRPKDTITVERIGQEWRGR